ncbi:MAG TPA: hypothetical protein VIV60_32830 [Polyangiaceae bacterium]
MLRRQLAVPTRTVACAPLCDDATDGIVAQPEDKLLCKGKPSRLLMDMIGFAGASFERLGSGARI